MGVGEEEPIKKLKNFACSSIFSPKSNCFKILMIIFHKNYRLSEADEVLRAKTSILTPSYLIFKRFGSSFFVQLNILRRKMLYSFSD